jgi:hypothetical protein
MRLPSILQAGRAAKGVEDVAEPGWAFLTSGMIYAFIILIQLFLLVNGEDYGLAWDVTATYILLPIGFAGALVFFARKLPEDLLPREPRLDPITRVFFPEDYALGRRPFVVQVLYYFLAMGAMYLIVQVLIYNGMIQVQQMTVGMAWVLILFQVCLVSTSETLVFHAMLPKLLNDHFLPRSNNLRLILRYSVSQAIFAWFHVSAYGGESSYMLGAFIFGCVVFLPVAENLGVVPCMGVHAAWNLGISGLLTAPLIGA